MENVIVLTFGSGDRARASLRGLRRLHDGGEIGLQSVAVVERTEDGRTIVLDQAEDVHVVATATGGLIGGIIGLIGGPVGVLIGGATGGVVGSLVDMAEVESSDGVLRTIASAVPRGRTATIAVVDEPTQGPVDALASHFGIAPLRTSRAEVESEIAQAQEAETSRQRDGEATRSIGDRLRDIRAAVGDRS